MNTTGENEIWTAPRLVARLAALKGIAPAPVSHVIYRVTAEADGRERAGYELPDETERRDGAFFGRWLLDRDLAGMNRLSVSVLVIRETLGDSGLVREGVLERRRGGADGPLVGRPARVEFTGAAQSVRRYQALRDGQLAEMPPEPGAAVPPQDGMDAEGFPGDDAAVRVFLGPGALILDRRPPTPSEELLGLSGIIHARRRDGVEVGCGVGWHGDIAFVLAADFPRRRAAPQAPPDLAAAVEAAIRAHDLIARETRLDERGFCVIAQTRGTHALVALRGDGGAVRIDPYTPGRIKSPTGDQARWMTYAETYESRVILDSWHGIDGDEIAVLTIDADGEAWRHIIDADGVEISRRSDNEAAAAVLHREALATLATAPPARAAPGGAMGGAMGGRGTGGDAPGATAPGTTATGRTRRARRPRPS